MFPNLFLIAETTSVQGILRDTMSLRRNEMIQNSFWDVELKEPEEVVDDLNPTEDGEASKKTHCASY